MRKALSDGEIAEIIGSLRQRAGIARVVPAGT